MRLLRVRRKYRQCFGNADGYDVYVSISAVLVESVIIYTIPQAIGNVGNLVPNLSNSVGQFVGYLGMISNATVVRVPQLI